MPDRAIVGSLFPEGREAHRFRTSWIIRHLGLAAAAEDFDRAAAPLREAICLSDLSGLSEIGQMPRPLDDHLSERLHTMGRALSVRCRRWPTFPDKELVIEGVRVLREQLEAWEGAAATPYRKYILELLDRAALNALRDRALRDAEELRNRRVVSLYDYRVAKAAIQ